MLKGPLAAYPVVGVKATLYDGSYHPVDSSEMAFKMATIMAFKKGFMEASPVLLEPIVTMKVTVPDKYTGDVMGDLNKRRGRVLGMNPDANGNQVIEADVPTLEIYGYSTVLRSMTEAAVISPMSLHATNRRQTRCRKERLLPGRRNWKTEKNKRYKTASEKGFRSCFFGQYCDIILNTRKNSNQKNGVSHETK